MHHFEIVPKLTGSFQDIMGEYESAHAMIDCLAKMPSLLAQLFEKSVQAQNYDVGFKICQKIITIDNSALSISEIMRVIEIANQLLCEKGDTENYIRAVHSLMDKLAFQKLTVGKALSFFKPYCEVKDSDTCGIAKKATDQHIAKLCLAVLSEHGIEIEIKDTCLLNMQIPNNKTAIALAKSIRKLELSEAPLVHQLEICKILFTKGELATRLVIHSFDKFNFSIAQRLELCYALLMQNSMGRILVFNIDTFNIGQASIKERLELCKTILLIGKEVGTGLAQNIHKFKLSTASIEQRLELCHALALQGINSTKALLENIEKFDLGAASLEQWLELCRAIVAKGAIAASTHAACALVNNIDKCQLRKASIAQQLELCKVLVVLGAEPVKILTENIKKFDLCKASLEQRLELCKAIVALGAAPAQILTENIEKFDLCKASLEQRLELCKAIVALGATPAQILTENIEKFDLRDASLAERLELCKAIVALGAAPAQILTENIEKFDLCKASLEQRLELCKAIVALGTESMQDLVKNMDKSGFKEAPLLERIELCKMIARQGTEAFVALATHFPKLGLEELTVEQQALFLDIPVKQMFEEASLFLKKIYHRNPEKLQELLADQLLSILNSAETPPEQKLVLARRIFYELPSLIDMDHLDIDHPLMQAAIGIICANQVLGAKNPFQLYTRLKNLARQASPFQPSKMEVGGINVAINLKHFQVASIKIKRTDLPKNVTLESFNAFFSNLKKKIQDGERREIPVAKAALDKLHTQWAEIVVPIEGDPDRYLLNLIGKTEGSVSESEAKWKAVLSSILDKSSISREEAFFSDQEEAFINTMIGLQNCQQGKMYGIAFAYGQLDPKYCYAVFASSTALQTLEQFKKAEVIKEALEAFATFLKSMPPDKEPIAFLCESSKGKARNELTGWISKLFADNPLLGCAYLATEDFIDFEISKIGAQAIVKRLNAKEGEIAEEALASLIAQLVGKTLAEHLGGETALMQELTGQACMGSIQQVPHQAVYLNNLIGPILGTVQTVTFDNHTGTLYDALIKRSREEVLELFFKHFTPEILAKELVHNLNKTLLENKAHLEKLLPKEKYWSSPLTINLQGALKLLLRFKYLV